MKGRSSLIYLCVFLLFAGYYYYFEVVRKDQKEAAERESRRLLRFQVESVQNLEILAKEKKKLSLKKGEQWQIVEPIKADVDSGSLQDYLQTLARVDFEKEISSSPGDLGPYGLKNPALKLRWQVGEQWMELLVGDKNPAGDGYYARTGDKDNVVLISAGILSVLSRNLDEMRKKELFGYLPKDVRGLHVAWREGNTVSVQRPEEGDAWKATEHSELKVKSSKVDNILEQLSWLRARRFLENEPTNLKKHGLDPSHVVVKVTLKDNKTAEMHLSQLDKDRQNLAALSSQLPGVALVDGNVLKDLPLEIRALEDRSLLGVKREEVKQIKWRLGEKEGHAVQTGDNAWSLQTAGGGREPVKEPWPVRSLLWDLADAEYDKKLDPKLPLPEKLHGKIEIWNQETRLAAFSWEKQPETGTGPATLWTEHAGKLQPVEVNGEAISKIEEDLSRLFQPEADKKGS